MDMMKAGIEWLDEQLGTHASALITYDSSVGTVCNIGAVYGQTKFETSDEMGMTVTSYAHDFIVMASALPAHPFVGDTIVAGGKSYEVLDLANSGCWSWCDPYETMYRIHTKEV